MRFACEQCQTKYSIPDERVRGKILKIRCKTCGCLISVSEAGARTSRVGEPAADPGQSTAGLDLRDQLASEGGGGGGDATMIGGMADFFGKLPGTEPPASDDWHLSIDGNQEGPFPLSNLAQRIMEQAGTSAELYVWHEGFDGWKLPDSIPEVQNAVSKARGGQKPAAKEPTEKGAGYTAGKDSGKALAKDSAKVGAKASAKASAKEAAKPAVKSPAKPIAAAASSEDAGDATQIGSLDIPSAPARPASKGGGDDDDVQDASLLMLGDDAFDALLEKSSGAKAAQKPGAKPTAKPTPPSPGPKPAPPAFKPPPALSRTLPLGSQLVPPSAKAPAATPSAKPEAPAPAPAAQPTPAAPKVELAPAPPAVALAPSTPAVSVNQAPSPPAPQAVAPQAPEPAPAPAPASASAFADLSLTPPPASAAFGVVSGGDLGADHGSSGENRRKSKAWVFVLLAVLAATGGGGYWLVQRSQTTKPSGRAGAIADAGSDAGTASDGGSQAAGSGKTEEPTTPKPGDVGELPMSVLEDLLKSGHSALDKCYAKALKKNADLAGAKLKAIVDVADKGKASSVELSGPESDGKLGKCVQKALKKWKYPRQKDDYKTTFTLTVKAKGE